MRLIDEIEAAAKRSTIAADAGEFPEGEWDDVVAEDLIGSPWWPRIRAALEAAEEMDRELTVYYELYRGGNCEPSAIQRRFRAANRE